MISDESSSIILPQKTIGIKKRTKGHKLVVETAREMALAVYEECALVNNEWYKVWPSSKRYVEKSLPLFIPKARATLVDLMNRTKDESLKEKIYEALCLDNEFIDRIVS